MTTLTVAAPLVEDKGWELKVELARPGEPVLVGEYGEDIPVTVTLKNTTGKERGYVSPPRSVHKHVLDANITQPDGKVMGQMCRLTPPDDFKNLTPVAAGKAATFTVTPADFAFHNFRQGGKHTLQMTSRTPDGTVTSNAITFEVADPHKKNGLTTLRIQSVGCEIEERLVFEAEADDGKATGELFKSCKFATAADVPPEKLRLTYAALVASVKTGGQAKFCLRSVEVIDREVPDRPMSAQGINIPWMKTNFSAEVVMCEKQSDGTFYFRTNTSLLYWVEARSGEWKLFMYGDKPIK